MQTNEVTMRIHGIQAAPNGSGGFLHNYACGENGVVDILCADEHFGSYVIRYFNVIMVGNQIIRLNALHVVALDLRSVSEGEAVKTN